MARATRVLAEGIYFGEGPRWRGGRLWFSGLRLLVEGRELSLGLWNLHARRQAAHDTGEECHPTAGEQLPIRERS